jgi:hypothetical protein
MRLATKIKAQFFMGLHDLGWAIITFVLHTFCNEIPSRKERSDYC